MNEWKINRKHDAVEFLGASDDSTVQNDEISHFDIFLTVFRPPFSSPAIQYRKCLYFVIFLIFFFWIRLNVVVVQPKELESFVLHINSKYSKKKKKFTAELAAATRKLECFVRKQFHESKCVA